MNISVFLFSTSNILFWQIPQKKEISQIKIKFVRYTISNLLQPVSSLFSSNLLFPQVRSKKSLLFLVYTRNTCFYQIWSSYLRLPFQAEIWY